MSTLVALPPDLRRWLAIGTGLGVEIDGDQLRAVIVRVRPSGAVIEAAATIARFRERPAAEWGREFTQFLARHGGGHLAATVLLPRREVIVRQLALEGVAVRDFDAAMHFQSEALHPYEEEEAACAWSRCGRTSDVLVGIAQRTVLENYRTLFAEAGIKIAAFSFSAAVVYSAIRLLSAPPRQGFLALLDGEVYGESAARPVFSAVLDLPPERAAALAAAELRLEADVEPMDLPALLPRPRVRVSDFDFSRNALVYAAALAGACPRLASPVNLLPEEHRSSSSRVMYVPTFALAGVLVLVLAGLAAVTPIEDRRYLAALEAEIARLSPVAAKAGALDRQTQQARARALLLDAYRGRTKADLDVLGELTRLLPPPTYLNSVEITRATVTLNGEAEQAAGLLKTLDASPLFQDSEFGMPIARVGGNEAFRVRTSREGVR